MGVYDAAHTDFNALSPESLFSVMQFQIAVSLLSGLRKLWGYSGVWIMKH